jgi:hypothetical protein
MTADFDKGGRPDVMKLVRDAYWSWGAEVVFITSNYQGNKEIMEGCKIEGIPAFVRVRISHWVNILIFPSLGNVVGLLKSSGLLRL